MTSRARLVGVVHLPPLPGSPLAEPGRAGVAATIRRAVADARALADAGYDVAMLENFGDVPFVAGAVAPETVAAITACAQAVREALPSLALGVNVLRNDARSALGVAVAVGARCIRVNVHTGARVTDQGVIEGTAAETMRARRALLGAEAASLEVWADVDVKHSAPLAPRPVEEEAEETALRALADAVLVTGAGTGRATDLDVVARVRSALPAHVPVLVASGARESSLVELRARGAGGVVVGSALRADGVAGGPIDPGRARAFAAAFRAAFGG